MVQRPQGISLCGQVGQVVGFEIGPDRLIRLGKVLLEPLALLAEIIGLGVGMDVRAVSQIGLYQRIQHLGGHSRLGVPELSGDHRVRVRSGCGKAARDRRNSKPLTGLRPASVRNIRIGARQGHFRQRRLRDDRTTQQFQFARRRHVRCSVGQRLARRYQYPRRRGETLRQRKRDREAYRA